MEETLVKDSAVWKLRARYQDSKVLLYLKSPEGPEYGVYPSMYLSADEWDVLVAWVGWQRAKERVVAF